MVEASQGTITQDDVRHVAKLARLRLNDQQVEVFQRQLASILRHVSTLRELDVTGIEPMAHPIDLTNRMDDDEPVQPMSVDDVLRLAPDPQCVEGRYLAVPKVLADESPAQSRPTP